jgi:hypothetical protein
MDHMTLIGDFLEINRLNKTFSIDSHKICLGREVAKYFFRLGSETSNSDEIILFLSLKV